MSFKRSSNAATSTIEPEHLDVQNIHQAIEWFQVLQTGKTSQTAVMRLEPGQSSGESKSIHNSSDQILLVVEGDVFAEVGTKSVALKPGDSMLVSAGMQHKFTNHGNKTAVTFNVYSPPEYPFR